MYTFLVILFVIASIFLILVVLLQQGKGAGMGAAFGGGSQTLFGGRGQATPLQKATVVMALLYMALSVALASLSTGHRSALAGEEPPPEHEAGLDPETPADAPAEKDTADKPADKPGDAAPAPAAPAPTDKAPAESGPAAPAPAPAANPAPAPATNPAP
jgi:preprotein translocase subunit SecG